MKTLHPHLYAALLAVRDNPEHAQTLRELEIDEIDLVCVNLYPFERIVAQRDVPEEEAIENIDIGGPTMIRGGCEEPPVHRGGGAARELRRGAERAGGDGRAVRRDAALARQ